jgi:hypothetical protein
MSFGRRVFVIGMGGLCVAAAVEANAQSPQQPSQLVAPPDFGVRLAHAARAQVGVTTGYDPAYVRLVYPMGDVPADRGVCTDVVIRAYRAIGFDLQALVHRDMRANFNAYPKLWGLTRPDRNIDHRRVPNLETYFRRQGAELARSSTVGDYRAGDVVSWRLTGSGLAHIGIVSARRLGNDRPLIVHNIGAGVLEEDILFRHPITARFRWAPRT